MEHILDLNTEIERLVKDKGVKEAIIYYLNNFDYVSFAELEIQFKSFFNTDNENKSICIGGNENLVVWWGTGILIDIIHQITTGFNREFYFEASQTIVYLADGIVLPLPILTKKSNPLTLKTTHWIPVTIRHIKYKKERGGLKDA